jgi:DNA processing protein
MICAGLFCMEKIFTRKEVCLLWFWSREISQEWISSLPDSVSIKDLKMSLMREFFWEESRCDFLLEELAKELQGDKSYTYVYSWEEEFPQRLKSLEDCPLVLAYQGNLELLNRPGIGIVGSRKLRSNVSAWSEIHLSKFLENYPTPIISGAAQGVDQLAHRLAIRKSIPTIAFLPCGFSRIYPSSFQKIFHQIIEEQGCVLSEYPRNFEVKRYSFHQRNRLIAAQSHLLLVLQAERRSGSLITANVARRIGVDLAALPGDPTDSVFWGTNDLIAEGAGVLRDRDDLVSFYSRSLHRINSTPF